MHTSEYSEIYKQAGVDTQAAQRLIQKTVPFIKKTFHSHVLSDIGGFASWLDLSFVKSMKNPVLLTSTDGVGTKLLYATFLNRYDTVGFDLVGMCANDLLVSGGIPLALLDYVAVGRLDEEKISLVLRSIASACKLIHCALIGGETAEHPNVMKNPDDFDLAGFIIGVAEKENLLPHSIQEGDIVMGIPSSGVHSNGLSLVRKLFFDPANPFADKIANRDFIKEKIFLQPTVLYEKILRDLIESKLIKGLVHITGGGFIENIPRILPDDHYVELQPWELETPFREIAQKGNLDFQEMIKVFNCGFGMIAIIREKDVPTLQKELPTKIKEYKKQYQSIQKEFFPEFPQWENDWTLPYLSETPRVLGRIKKNRQYSKKVILKE
ncbi:MAG: phosphoribosylformylglycinamidine cyclo-ligase [Leptospiraceae bacterium]|nr:phosphoribosylformylglycinamidine cyclo-ligase [Leptospiraceae bacterium]MDW7977002.1 phosphoribosylformylglycinamidine cyclo-ligase [Leptospiraceae bacterium]